MRIVLAIIFFIAIGSVHAQSIEKDSISLKILTPDSLTTKLNSLNSEFNKKSDSLKFNLQKGLSEIEGQRTALQQRIDSLSTFGHSTNESIAKLDSLNNKAKAMVISANNELEKIKSSTLDKIDELQLPDEFQSKVNTISNSISGNKLKGFEGIDISSLGLDNLSNLDFGNLGKFDLDGISENLSLPNEPLSDVRNLTDIDRDQLGNIKGLENLTDITDQIGGYSEDIKSIASGDLNNVQQIPQAIENELMQMEELGALSEGTVVLDEYKGMAESIKDPEAMKEIAIEKAKEVAIDHFAGKEQVLSDAMQKIAKYKQQYSSLNSIKDVAKKQANPLKRKPLIERIVPGINFQILKKNDLLVDINPHASYRITGRLSAGAGWNYRLAYNEQDNQFNRAARIFGPRAFCEFKIGKGFTGHFSIEVMNTNTPPIIGLTPTPLDPEHREWVWGSFAGLKKEYKLFKNVRGTATILYNLYNPDYKSPYSDQINMRFGFEFPMKKKVKQDK